MLQLLFMIGAQYNDDDDDDALTRVRLVIIVSTLCRRTGCSLQLAVLL